MLYPSAHPKCLSFPMSSLQFYFGPPPPLPHSLQPSKVPQMIGGLSSYKQSLCGACWTPRTLPQPSPCIFLPGASVSLQHDTSVFCVVPGSQPFLTDSKPHLPHSQHTLVPAATATAASPLCPSDQQHSFQCQSTMIYLRCRESGTGTSHTYSISNEAMWRNPRCQNTSLN